MAIGAITLAVFALFVVIGFLVWSGTRQTGSGGSTAPTGGLPGIPLLNGERSEAIRWCALMSHKQGDLVRINGKEVEAINYAAQWSSNIAMFGETFFRDQDQQKGRYTSNAVGAVRQDLSGLIDELGRHKLDYASNQTQRDMVLTPLRQRLAFLREVEALVKSGTDQVMTVPTQQVPGDVSTLYSKLKTYQSPTDVLLPAVRDTRTKFNITDAELASSSH